MAENITMESGRAFTFRAVAVGTFALIILAVWVHFHEVLVPMANILAENSPPAGAVGVLLGVIGIGVLLARLRPSLRLSRGELAVVYAMLVAAAPIMSQGMWHRFLGLVSAIPLTPDYQRLTDSYSEKLWPHGEQLISNRRFAKGLKEVEIEPAERARLFKAERTPVGAVTALELVNPESAEYNETAILRIPIKRFNSAGRERLVPGERYYFAMLVRLEDMAVSSRLDVDLDTDDGGMETIRTLTRKIPDAFSTPGGFQRFVTPYVTIPRRMVDRADLVFTLTGPGRAALTDICFFSNEALARMYKGCMEVRESDIPLIPVNDRNSMVIRPDNLFSIRGILYILKGYIPYSQWLQPLLYWFAIVLAIFGALYGVAIIFRRQWEDVERFGFPIARLPSLFLEERDKNGTVQRPIFHTKMFKAGVITALVLGLIRGIAYYVPGAPSLEINVNLLNYVASHPVLSAFMRGMTGFTFQVLWIFVAVAFFVDLELLASMLVFFLLARIPYALGEMTGWKNISGDFGNFPFPHEQHIGAFLGLAVVALWVSRRHLVGVFNTIVGRPGGWDDRQEIMRYRTAAILVLLCVSAMALWGSMSGMGPWNALLFFGFMLVCGFVAARIRTEFGAPGTYFTPYNPFLIFFLFGGLRVFSPQTMVLAYVAGGFMAVAQFLMFAPTQVEMMHFANRLKVSRRGLALGVTFGIVAGLILGGYVMLVWAYGRGGENIDYMRTWALRQHWYFSSLYSSLNKADAYSVAQAAGAGEGLARMSQGWGPMIAVGSGATVTLVVAALRTWISGFWLHPIGYVLANSHFISCWGSLLTAFVIKFISLKIGGPRFVREQMMPYFAGMFCGVIGAMLLWDIIAAAAMGFGVREVFTLLM